ncbi:MAG TPA: hypothetical protein DCW90_09500 [Lachnospiraceae bacterium]|nr:hypothetical protein [Lachnospiraceae bacterium]
MIYLDSAATTRPYDEVIEVVADTMRNHYGNASSIYEFGKQSLDIITQVRQQFAEDLNCDVEDIIFTSGACEANSMVINHCKKVDGVLITSRLEHKSIELGAQTCVARYVQNDKYGMVDIQDLESILKYIPQHKPKIVSICAANSEIGTIQDIKKISDRVHKFGGIFHCDATQLFPYERIDMKSLGIDMLSLSAQKFHGPKGIGILTCHIEDITCMIYGSQESYRRGGTYNTPLIAGMGMALKMLDRTKADVFRKYTYEIWNELSQQNVKLVGHPIAKRLPNHLALYVPRAKADDIISIADVLGVCISAGSACNSGNPVPSQSLMAIGMDYRKTQSIIRISVDDLLTWGEVTTACRILKQAVTWAKLRSINDEEW